MTAASLDPAAPRDQPQKIAVPVSVVPTMKQSMPAAGTYFLNCAQQGEELVISAIRERRPIPQEQIIDLLAWTKSAEGTICMASTSLDGTQSFTMERIDASTTPQLRLEAAIRFMARVIDAVVADGRTTINLPKR